jgi:hypothetical protein
MVNHLVAFLAWLSFRNARAAAPVRVMSRSQMIMRIMREQAARRSRM